MHEPTTRSATPGFRATCVCLLAFGLGWLSSCTAEVKPLRARQNAILRTLKETASDVNAYQKTHGVLSDSRKGILLPNEGYRLVVPTDGSSFLVVADRVFLNETGARFQFACDEKLQIQKLSVSSDNDSLEAERE